MIDMNTLDLDCMPVTRTWISTYYIEMDAGIDDSLMVFKLADRV